MSMVFSEIGWDSVDFKNWETLYKGLLFNIKEDWVYGYYSLYINEKFYGDFTDMNQAKEHARIYAEEHGANED
ncbi:hypothetical protein DSS3PM1_00015 [Bacteriophage DSS3_PM1]|nr:hypothetical protein DSS3PM1_00015 [Bacteriophage DSS3_PM1]